VNTYHVPQSTWGPYPQPTNHWTFLALTYDGASLKLYGGDPTSPVVLATSTDILNSPVDLSGSPFSLFLGNRLNRDRGLAGMLGDVRLYHGAASVGSLDAIRQSAVPAVATPVASFTALPASGTRPLLVTFTDHSTGTITNLLWTFGDGDTTNTAVGSVVTHVYGADGSYNAILTASGPGGSSTATNAISVAVPNQPHVASLTAGTGSLTMQGNNGPASASQTYYYWLLTSTNLSLPRTSWTAVATNAFRADGSFSNSIPVVPGDVNRFYLLQMP
jgi:hypothetical protein